MKRKTLAEKENEDVEDKVDVQEQDVKEEKERKT